MLIAPNLVFEAELFNRERFKFGKIIVKTDVVNKSNKVYNLEFNWTNCGNVVGKCCG